MMIAFPVKLWEALEHTNINAEIIKSIKSLCNNVRTQIENSLLW